jgi:hypothetical protein
MVEHSAIEPHHESPGPAADPEANSALHELAAQTAAAPAIRSRSIYLPARRKAKPFTIALTISLFVHAILLFGLVEWVPKFLPMMTGKAANAASVNVLPAGANAAKETPVPAGAISIGDLQRRSPALGMSIISSNDLSEPDLDFTTAPWPKVSFAGPAVPSSNQSLTAKLFADPPADSFGPPAAELFAGPAARQRPATK